MMNAHVQAALHPPEGLTPEEWPAYLAWLAGHAEEAEEKPPAVKKKLKDPPRKKSPPPT